MEEIKLLIAARYPIIYIVSWEEARVEQALIQLAAKMKKKPFVWSATSGLYSPPEKPKGVLTDPLMLLAHLPETEPSSLFILKDFTPWFNDARTARGIRDLLAPLRTAYKTLILLSPELVIPVSLEKDVTVIDYNLPDVEELGAVFDKTYDAVSVNAKLKLTVSRESKGRFARACTGLTLTEAENAFARAVAHDGEFSESDFDAILKEKKNIIRRSRFLEYCEAPETPSDVGGVKPLKKWLGDRLNAFGDGARQFGLPEPKGVLLFGVQGCGKSLMCKTIANAWKMPMLRLDMGAIFGIYIGLSEENMRKAIKTAESVAPCILWVDEFEKGFAGTGPGAGDSGTSARVIGTFLTWMQEKKAPVFIAATSNNILSLPPEILRKGRFDELFFIDLPSPEERKEIFNIHIAKRGRQPDAFDLNLLAGSTEGFSGAEIEQCVIDGLFTAFGESREINTGDIVNAADACVPLSKTMEESIGSLRKWAKARTRYASEHTEENVRLGFGK